MVKIGEAEVEVSATGSAGDAGSWWDAFGPNAHKILRQEADRITALHDLDPFQIMGCMRMLFENEFLLQEIIDSMGEVIDLAVATDSNMKYTSRVVGSVIRGFELDRYDVPGLPTTPERGQGAGGIDVHGRRGLGGLD